MNLRLRQLRESQGISVATMVDRLGIQDSRYRKWESQAAAMPLEYAIRCCSILHCTMDELTDRGPMVLSADERTILNCYRRCNDVGRDYLLNLAEVTAKQFQRMDDSSSSDGES